MKTKREMNEFKKYLEKVDADQNDEGDDGVKDKEKEHQERKRERKK